MNREDAALEDYSRLIGDTHDLEKINLAPMSCGRTEMAFKLTDKPDYVILGSSFEAVQGHTFEDCVRINDDKATLQYAVDWMAGLKVEEFVIEVPFFRKPEFKKRMPIKFKLGRSGKYGLYAYNDYSPGGHGETPIGSYAGGGRVRILHDLIDEVEFHIDQLPGLHWQSMECEGHKTHRQDLIMLEARLLRNTKFWNVWLYTHKGYCPLCCAGVTELPQIPAPPTMHHVDQVLDFNASWPQTQREYTSQPHRNGKSETARAINNGKLPPLSPDFDPTAPIDADLINQTNGVGTAANAKPVTTWKPKKR